MRVRNWGGGGERTMGSGLVRGQRSRNTQRFRREEQNVPRLTARTTPARQWKEGSSSALASGTAGITVTASHTVGRPPSFVTNWLQRQKAARSVAEAWRTAESPSLALWRYMDHHDRASVARCLRHASQQIPCRPRLDCWNAHKHRQPPIRRSGIHAHRRGAGAGQG